LNSAAAATHRFPLEISPDSIDFGILPPGEAAEACLTVRNTQDDSVVLERIQTSCPCIEATPAPTRIGPRQAEKLKVIFNASRDGDVGGPLSVELTGHLADGRIGFRALVRLQIELGEP
jgi:hypothetical protein